MVLRFWQTILPLSEFLPSHRMVGTVDGKVAQHWMDIGSDPERCIHNRHALPK